MSESLALIAPMAAVVSGAVAVVGLMITARVMTAKADLVNRINEIAVKMEGLTTRVGRLEQDSETIRMKRAGDAS